MWLNIGDIIPLFVLFVLLFIAVEVCLMILETLILKILEHKNYKEAYLEQKKQTEYWYKAYMKKGE